MRNDSNTLGKAFMPPLPDNIPPSWEPSFQDNRPFPLPTPEPLIFPQPWPPKYKFHSLRCGCYIIKLTSSTNNLSVADGTLRVECHENGRAASGDLYNRGIIRICPQVRHGWPRKCFSVLAPGPNPSDGIPVFPRDRYRYYIRVTRILEWITAASSFNLAFDMYRFDSNSKSWSIEDAYTAQMSWTTAPAGYPSHNDYLEGEVKNNAGVVVGRLSMGWISKYLRRAVVEVDRVSAAEAPLNNGATINWGSIFDQVDWDVTVVESNTNVTEVSGEGWSDAECHQGMLTWRDSVDLDTQWHYHLLCVRRLESTSRGIMYDSYGGDSNNIPREGAALASHWSFPKDIPWGKCKGIRFGAATGPYFRTAVHEIAHAMMMFHPSSTSGNHIMQVTPQIADNATASVQFPDNIDWSFSSEDQRLLRHLPDIVVRPGTVVRFGTDVSPGYSGIPISPLDFMLETKGLALDVSTLLEVVPIGAPVRVDFRVINQGSESILVPQRLNMKSGYVAGSVVDPSGSARPFSSIIRELDEHELQILDPGKESSDSLTLLRGPDGGLFPMPGIHKVILNITWETDGYPVVISGDTSIMVTPPVDEAHAKAALKVLSTPDILVTMVSGGDHLTDGVEAIQTAVKDSVLRPHFAYIEAKRLAQSFGKRKANLKEMATLIKEETVMSSAEIKKAAKLVKAKGIDNSISKTVAKALRSKARKQVVTDEIKKTVDSI